jgi:hypothetical protein
VYFALETYYLLNSALELRKTITDEHYIFTSQTLEEAFWRTLIGDKTHEDVPAPEAFEQQWSAAMIRQQFIRNALEIASRDGDIDTSTFTIDDPTGEYIKSVKGSKLYLQSLMNMIYTRAFAITEKNYMCMVPGDSQPGDAVILVAGSESPFVFRGTENGNWILLGECYVHGVIRGELNGKTDSLQWVHMNII